MREQRLRDGTCKLTFEPPAGVDATTAHLCGGFDDWSTTATPMTRRRNGTFAATIRLAAGSSYRFRYLLDGHRWENDWAADDDVRNDDGDDDSVVTT